MALVVDMVAALEHGPLAEFFNAFLREQVDFIMVM